MTAKFKIGDKVCKPKGYDFHGTVISAYQNSKGEQRYDVELAYNGMIHVFSENQLEHLGDSQIEIVVTERKPVFQEWVESPDVKTGWVTDGWFFSDDSPMGDEWEIQTIVGEDKHGRPAYAIALRTIKSIQIGPSGVSGTSSKEVEGKEG